MRDYIVLFKRTTFIHTKYYLHDEHHYVTNLYNSIQTKINLHQMQN